MFSCDWIVLREGGILASRGRLVNERTTWVSDEKTLYVAQSDGNSPIWRSYPVRRDGTLGKGKRFFDATPYQKDGVGGPDGMKVDREGNLWATGPAGLYIFSPEGDLLDRLAMGLDF